MTGLAVALTARGFVQWRDGEAVHIEAPHLDVEADTRCLVAIDADYAAQRRDAGSGDVARARELQARRGFLSFASTEAWPTAPSSVASCLALVRALAKERVWLDVDLDGLSVLLGEEGKRVVVHDADASTARWLSAQGPEVRFGAADAPVDVAVVHLAAPERVASALLRATAQLGSDGRLVVVCRAVCEAELARWLEVHGRCVTLRRDAVLDLLPGGFAADDTGSLAVLEVTRRPSAATPARVLPALALDLDGLARSDADAARRFLDATAAYAPRPEGARRLSPAGRKLQLGWWDAAGYGFFAELDAQGRKLVLELAPYDLGVEMAARAAAAQVFADEVSRFRLHDLTRLRPRDD